MAKEIGRFYFKRSINGNLLGEYSHNNSTNIESESATAIEGTNDFIGIYNSYWNQTDEALPITLSISIKQRTNNSIYTLTWTENKVIIFWGEGMLCDNILIGNYRN